MIFSDFCFCRKTFNKMPTKQTHVQNLVHTAQSYFIDCREAVLKTDFLTKQYPLSEGRWNAILFKSIEDSSDLVSLFKAFIAYGKLVDADLAPTDALNVCDGSNSPLSTFIRYIFDNSFVPSGKRRYNPETDGTEPVPSSELKELSLLTAWINHLAGDAVNEGRAPSKWLIYEMCCICWSDPETYFLILMELVKNPVIGPYFDVTPVRFAFSNNPEELDVYVKKFMMKYVGLHSRKPQTYFGEKYNFSECLTLDIWLMIQNDDIVHNQNKYLFSKSKNYINSMIFPSEMSLSC